MDVVKVGAVEMKVEAVRILVDAVMTVEERQKMLGVDV